MLRRAAAPAEAITNGTADGNDGDPVYAGTFHGDPRYGKQQSDPDDIAVVVLDQPVTTINPAPLPAAGSMASLRAGQKITSVGYDAYDVVNLKGAGGHDFLYDDVRNQAVGSLNAVNPVWLRISTNPSTGNGGTCYGDSGGPNFLGTTTTLAAITISGDYICRATNVTYRLDTPAARSFLEQYVTLP